MRRMLAGVLVAMLVEDVWEKLGIEHASFAAGLAMVAVWLAIGSARKKDDGV